MSEAEYVAWTGDDRKGTEWVAGEVLFKMPIDELHDMLQSAIKECVVAIVRKNALGRVRGDRFAMRLPQRPSRREPDIMFIATNNPSPYSPTLLDGPCDLAVEIVSPHSIDDDYSAKFVEYQDAGVREYWIVDPMRKAIIAYRLDAQTKHFEPIAADTNGRIHSAIIAGWWLDASMLFREPTPSALDLIQALGIA